MQYSGSDAMMEEFTRCRKTQKGGIYWSAWKVECRYLLAQSPSHFSKNKL